jgi:hypothetical protein
MNFKDDSYDPFKVEKSELVEEYNDQQAMLEGMMQNPKYKYNVEELEVLRLILEKLFERESKFAHSKHIYMLAKNIIQDNVYGINAVKITMATLFALPIEKINSLLKQSGGKKHTRKNKKSLKHRKVSKRK